MVLGIAFGTRPEWLKVRPVVEELEKRNIPFHLIFTGQHETLVKDISRTMRGIDIALDEHFDRRRLDNIVYSVLGDTNEWLSDITKLMVQGDTTSAFACALAAFHRQIPVIHLEAGLRTNDLEQPFPEEANRQMISCIAALHLCPTKLARDNLVRENKHLQSYDIIVTGNTSLDNIKDVQTSLKKRILVTMHRRENHECLSSWFLNLDELAGQYSDHEFLLPLHPNPNVVKYRDSMKHIKVVDPMSHDDLIGYLASCKYVITDSGGIQEEAAFLKKPCMVCRKETERTEGLANFSILCKGPEYVSDIYNRLPHLMMKGSCPYGDGQAAEKVVDAIQGL